jgi:hypothetical protein
VKTEIDFLRELEADLDRVAHVAPVRARRPGRGMVARRPGKRVLALAAVAFLVLAGTLGFFLRSQAEPRRLSPLAAPSYRSSNTTDGDLRSEPPGPGGAVVHGPAKTVTTGPLPAPVPAGVPASRLGGFTLVAPQIVKTARMSLEVPKGQFDDSYRQASLVASKYGGFVDSASTSGSNSKSGSLEIRVPSVSFDRAVADLGALGKVLSRSVDGTDVTAEYVDLQARVRTWQAQEDVLLKLMAKATTVQDTLRVQNQLQDVQLQIERLQGQLRVLDDQTANGTISVSLREAGSPVKKQQKEAAWLPSFRGAWHDAVRGLVNVVFAVLVGLGYLFPITVVVLGVWFIYRRIRVGVRV